MMDSIFVWTFHDVFGLVAMAIIVLIFALLFITIVVQEQWRKFKKWWKK